MSIFFFFSKSDYLACVFAVAQDFERFRHALFILVFYFCNNAYLSASKVFANVFFRVKKKTEGQGGLINCNIFL